MTADRKLKTPPSKEFAAFAEAMEANLEFLGKREASRYLRLLSKRLTRPPETNVVGLRESEADDAETRAGRQWLRDQIPDWLGKYGR